MRPQHEGEPVRELAAHRRLHRHDGGQRQRAVGERRIEQDAGALAVVRVARRARRHRAARLDEDDPRAIRREPRLREVVRALRRRVAQLLDPRGDERRVSAFRHHLARELVAPAERVPPLEQIGGPLVPARDPVLGVAPIAGVVDAGERGVDRAGEGAVRVAGLARRVERDRDGERRRGRPADHGRGRVVPPVVRERLLLEPVRDRAPHHLEQAVVAARRRRQRKHRDPQRRIDVTLDRHAPRVRVERRDHLRRRQALAQPRERDVCRLADRRLADGAARDHDRRTLLVGVGDERAGVVERQLADGVDGVGAPVGVAGGIDRVEERASHRRGAALAVAQPRRGRRRARGRRSRGQAGAADRHPVRLEREQLADRGRARDGLVVGVVGRGLGVPGEREPAELGGDRRLVVAGDVLDREQQVLDEVREPLLAGRIVRGADRVAHVESHHGRARLRQDREAVAAVRIEDRAAGADVEVPVRLRRPDDRAARDHDGAPGHATHAGMVAR